MSGKLLSELHGQTILIVDDTPANLGVAIDHLEEHGFRVRIAQDGEEALRRAEVVRPDLILLDVLMPGIDGFETCRRLKAIDGTRDIPVIFMTALADTDNKVAAFAAGGVDYVTKPFQVEELLARVTTHLMMRTAQMRLAVQNEELREEVAARRAAEAAQRASELNYRRLFETAKDGILLADFETGQVIDVNASLIAMVGYCHAELLGRKLWELEPFTDMPAFPATEGELQAEDCVRADHRSLRNRNGSFLDVEVVSNTYLVDGARVVQCNIRDITERKQAEARIRYMALHDALTGLPNRVLLQDRLSQVIPQAHRNQKQVVVLMLDLDHFKLINDSLGHHVGDRLLEAAAMRLRTCLRESDIAARLGGDEFVIALPEAAGDQDAKIRGREGAEAARRALPNRRPRAACRRQYRHQPLPGRRRGSGRVAPGRRHRYV